MYKNIEKIIDESNERITVRKLLYHLNLKGIFRVKKRRHGGTKMMMHQVVVHHDDGDDDDDDDSRTIIEVFGVGKRRGRKGKEKEYTPS